MDVGLTASAEEVGRARHCVCSFGCLMTGAGPYCTRLGRPVIEGHDCPFCKEFEDLSEKGERRYEED